MLGNLGDIPDLCRPTLNSPPDPDVIVCDFSAANGGSGLPDDGDYLVTVSNGNGQSQSDEYDLTIGAVGPVGPTGPQGIQGIQGDPALVPAFQLTTTAVETKGSCSYGGPCTATFVFQPIIFAACIRNDLFSPTGCGLFGNAPCYTCTVTKEQESLPGICLEDPLPRTNCTIPASIADCSALPGSGNQTTKLIGCLPPSPALTATNIDVCVGPLQIFIDGISSCTETRKRSRSRTSTPGLRFTPSVGFQLGTLQVTENCNAPKKGTGVRTTATALCLSINASP